MDGKNIVAAADMESPLLFKTIFMYIEEEEINISLVNSLIRGQFAAWCKNSNLMILDR